MCTCKERKALGHCDGNTAGFTYYVLSRALSSPLSHTATSVASRPPRPHAAARPARPCIRALRDRLRCRQGVPGAWVRRHLSPPHRQPAALCAKVSLWSILRSTSDVGGAPDCPAPTTSTAPSVSCRALFSSVLVLAGVHQSASAWSAPASASPEKEGRNAWHAVARTRHHDVLRPNPVAFRRPWCQWSTQVVRGWRLGGV